jgi:citrate synthase
MKNAQMLFEYEDHWETKMGAWFPGERVVVRGKDLFTELKDLRWMALLLYGITGRMPTEKQVRLFEAIWALTISYPDPRLWNNRIAALGGTTRTTAALAIGAATAVSEALIYGNRINMLTIDFFLRLKTQMDKGISLIEVVERELKLYGKIGGYGRPIVRQDERIKPLMALVEELGFAERPYIQLAFAVEKILAQRKGLSMNISGVAAALAVDQGFSRHEYHQYLVMGFSAGMFPCYADAKAKPEGCFFPLRCDRIQYEGKPRRVWEQKW